MIYLFVYLFRDKKVNIRWSKRSSGYSCILFRSKDPKVNDAVAGALIVGGKWWLARNSPIFNSGDSYAKRSFLISIDHLLFWIWGILNNVGPGQMKSNLLSLFCPQTSDIAPKYSKKETNDLVQGRANSSNAASPLSWSSVTESCNTWKWLLFNYFFFLFLLYLSQT